MSGLGVVEPMLARSIDYFPEPTELPGGCLYEPKFDGFRAIAHVADDHTVRLVSRRSKLLNQAFPDVVAAARRFLPASVVVDGEIVRWSAAGHLDFAALQHRFAAKGHSHELARSEPAHLVVFDILYRKGNDLRDQTLSTRRKALEEVFADIPRAAAITLMPQTPDLEVARQWVIDFAAAGIEGLVIKGAKSRYRPGRAWLKYRHRLTTPAIVGGVTGSLLHPESLILGRYGSRTHHLRVVGRTSPLNDRQAADLAGLLTAAGAAHPWPSVLPASWTGSLYGQEPIKYVRVRPTLVVDVAADVATDQRRWRHSLRYERFRVDLEPDEVPLDLDLEGLIDDMRWEPVHRGSSAH